MKRTLLALSLLATAGFSQPALADGDEEASGPFSVTITGTSDYRFRGQSQNSRDFAIQGSVDYEGASGFFAGVWASQIDFSDTFDFDSEVEIDLYAGYNFSAGEGTEGSLKATYYLYPDNPGSYEYWEFQLALTHSIDKVTLSGELNYSPDYFNETGSAVALAGGVEIALIENLSAGGHLGYQWIDDNALFGTDDYMYYDIGLTWTWSHFTFDARYVSTDLDNVACFSGTDLCEGGFVGTVSLSFP